MSNIALSSSRLALRSIGTTSVFDEIQFGVVRGVFVCTRRWCNWHRMRPVRVQWLGLATERTPSEAPVHPVHSACARVSTGRMHRTHSSILGSVRCAASSRCPVRSTPHRTRPVDVDRTHQRIRWTYREVPERSGSHQTRSVGRHRCVRCYAI